MAQDKIEDLIRRFTRDVEALMREQLREEVGKAIEATLTGLTRVAPRGGGRRGKKIAAARPEPKPAPAPPPPPAEAAPKRRGWTREAVVAELATWLLTGQVIEASHLTKHGKPGLVAAARKHFGRFDAALNAANVHLARLHPEGVPSAKNRLAHAAPAPAAASAPTPAPADDAT